MSTLLLLTVASLAVADPEVPETKPEAPEKQWNDAKANYRDQLQKLNDEVLARIASLEKKARESGDLTRVKQYKAMTDSFVDEGELPSVFNSAEYDRKLKLLQDDLRREAKLVIAAHLKEKRDYEAEDLDQDLKDILTADNEAGAGKRAAAASRKRFMNVSYGAAIVHVRGKKWEQVHPKTNKHVWWLTETGRDDNYVYLHCPDKDQTWRIGEKRMDFLQPDKSWAWLSNGYWERPDDR